MCLALTLRTSSFYSCEKLDIKPPAQLLLQPIPPDCWQCPHHNIFAACTTHSHNTHQISPTLVSSFPFCPHTRPCPFCLHCLFSLQVLDFKMSRSISQQPFGLHAAHPRNSSLSLGSACVMFAFLRPRCAQCLFCAGPAREGFSKSSS